MGCAVGAIKQQQHMHRMLQPRMRGTTKWHAEVVRDASAGWEQASTAHAHAGFRVWECREYSQLGEAVAWPCQRTQGVEQSPRVTGWQ